MAGIYLETRSHGIPDANSKRAARHETLRNSFEQSSLLTLQNTLQPTTLHGELFPPCCRRQYLIWEVNAAEHRRGAVASHPLNSKLLQLPTAEQLNVVNVPRRILSSWMLRLPNTAL